MISVCIPLYNGEKYIRKQLDSILCQLSSDDEIILSDDGSTDSTLEIINSYNDPRLKLLIHKKEANNFTGYYNTLFTINRNIQYALSNAKGDIIFLSDQDDIWLENKVKLFCESLSHADLVVGNCMAMDKDSVVIASYFDNFIKPSKSLIRTLYKSSFHGCCMAFRREILRTALPFPCLPIGHDTWIGIVAMCKYRIEFLSEITLIYRIHESNVSVSNFLKSTNSLYFKIKYRIYLCLAILKYFSRK